MSGLHSFLRTVQNAWLAAVAFLFVLALVPLVVSQGFVLHGLLISCLWAGLAISWNILAGFAGQFSFGHAAFFGVGAYTTVIVAVRLGVPPLFGILAGGMVAVVLAVIIGVPAFRLRGPYFSLATLALAEVARIVAIYWESLTGGASGLFMPPGSGLLYLSWNEKAPYFYVALTYLAAAWAISAVLRRSRLGYFLIAVREDQNAAEVAGINPTAVKMAGAILSAGLAGVGGGILACYLTFVEPQEVFGVQVSIQFLIMTIVGGIGTLSGPVVGAFLVTPIAEMLRSVIGSQLAGGIHQLIYGFVFLAIILFLPRGIAPALASIGRRAWAAIAERPVVAVKHGPAFLDEP